MPYNFHISSGGSIFSISPLFVKGYKMNNGGSIMNQGILMAIGRNYEIVLRIEFVRSQSKAISYGADVITVVFSEVR